MLFTKKKKQLQSILGGPYPVKGLFKSRFFLAQLAQALLGVWHSNESVVLGAKKQNAVFVKAAGLCVGRMGGFVHSASIELLGELRLDGRDKDGFLTFELFDGSCSIRVGSRT